MTGVRAMRQTNSCDVTTLIQTRLRIRSSSTVVAEVGGPSTQHAVQPVQQDGQWLVVGCSGHRAHLSLEGGDRLLGRVGVDHSLSLGAALPLAHDAEPEEVEALVNVSNPRLPC